MPTVDVLAYGLRTPERDVLVLRYRSPDGQHVSVLTAVCSRSGAEGLVRAHVVRDLQPHRARRVVDAVRAATGHPARPMSVGEARARLARAILVDRIGHRSTGGALEQDRRWLGPWHQAVATVDRLFDCGFCEAALSGSTQAAIARGFLETAGPLRCTACGGDLPRAAEVAEDAAPLAQLFLDAAEPRAALVTIARALAEGAEAPPLAGIRGAAHLRLGNPIQAAVHLRVAVNHAPANLRARALLVDASVRSGLLASAARELDAIARIRPAATSLTQACKAALGTIDRRAADPRLETHALQALAQLDAALPERARERLATTRAPSEGTTMALPALAAAREALDAPRAPMAGTRALEAWAPWEAAERVEGPLGVLMAAL